MKTDYKQQPLTVPDPIPFPSEPRWFGQPYTCEHSDKFAARHSGESMTKQSEAASCDVNRIVERYGKTGLLPDLMGQNPSYGDFSDVASFEEAIGIVAHANAQFAALDARVRARFNNDPAEMLRFVDDPKNQQEMFDLGLATARPAPPEPVKPTEPPKSTASKAKKAPEPTAQE